MIFKAANLPFFKKASYFLLLFITIKLSSFTSGLFLSNFAEQLVDFGIFEYALSFGIFGSVIADWGGSSAYVYFRFQKKGSTENDSSFFFHFLPLVVLVFAIFAVNQVYHFISVQYTLGLLILVIIGMQGRLSVYFKSGNRVYSSVLADGGLFVAINIYNLYLWYAAAYFSLNDLVWIISAYAAGIFALCCYFFIPVSGSLSRDNYRSVLKWGTRIVVSSFLVMGLTNSGRILIEYLTGTEQVGRYGFFFRLASVMVLVHQAINIFFFQKMYTAHYQALNRYISYFLAVMLAANLVIWLTLPYILQPYLKMLGGYGHTDSILFLTLCIHVYFWISSALYENIIYREDLAWLMNRYFVFILLIFLAFSFFAFKAGFASTELIGLINVYCLFLCTEAQYRCLKQKEMKLGKVRLMNVVAVLVFTFIIIIYY